MPLASNTIIISTPVANSAYTFTFSAIFTASPPDAIVLTWSWDFGDGIGTSTLSNPTYTYLSNNTFDPTVTVTCSAGATPIDNTYFGLTTPNPGPYTPLTPTGSYVTFSGVTLSGISV